MSKITKSKLKKECNPEHVFWVRDGSVLKNMEEMFRAIELMDEETFRHHVSEERNDFSNWLRDIHREEELAERLQRTLDRGEFLQVIRTTIELPVVQKKTTRPAKKKAAAKKAKSKKKK